MLWPNPRQRSMKKVWPKLKKTDFLSIAQGVRRTKATHQGCKRAHMKVTKAARNLQKPYIKLAKAAHETIKSRTMASRKATHAHKNFQKMHMKLATIAQKICKCHTRSFQRAHMAFAKLDIALAKNTHKIYRNHICKKSTWTCWPKCQMNSKMPARCTARCPRDSSTMLHLPWNTISRFSSRRTSFPNLWCAPAKHPCALQSTNSTSDNGLQWLVDKYSMLRYQAATTAGGGWWAPHW